MVPKTPTRRSREPVQQRSREAASALKTAAAKVLVQHGYAHATTNRIAQRAGVSIGTLYQYFPNKDAVFQACAADFLVVLRDASKDAVRDASTHTLEQRLERLARSAVEVLAAHPGFLRALDAAPIPGFREITRRAREEVRAEIETMLAQLRPEATPHDNAYAARVLAAAGEGIALDVLPGDDLDRLAREISKLALRYLATA